MSPIGFLEEKLQKGHTVLLDGATGTELEHRGVPMNSAAWSVEAVYSHPDVVQDIHEDYIRAGVDVITVNSFSMGRHMFISAGLADDFRQLNRSAVELAIRARDRTATAPVAIAGSIAPTTITPHPKGGGKPF
ncbi:Homocysteine S-methyltransferase [Candidatus Electrothrix marina]|uniref:Homocysteine S-methyltransferase n=1 Tax=Candidatus Electrothrix marina TaxID=1859130 RepID=A0A444JFB0_9BACT|nr:Homocysteine S-methyltransferase [Candidatus Electrothrix marina]